MNKSFIITFLFSISCSRALLCTPLKNPKLSLIKNELLQMEISAIASFEETLPSDALPEWKTMYTSTYPLLKEAVTNYVWHASPSSLQKKNIIESLDFENPLYAQEITHAVRDALSMHYIDPDKIDIFLREFDSSVCYPPEGACKMGRWHNMTHPPFNESSGFYLIEKPSIHINDSFFKYLYKTDPSKVNEWRLLLTFTIYQAVTHLAECHHLIYSFIEDISLKYCTPTNEHIEHSIRNIKKIHEYIATLIPCMLLPELAQFLYTQLQKSAAHSNNVTDPHTTLFPWVEKIIAAHESP